MISIDRCNDAIRCFINDFDKKHWEDENFKWIAVKCFQENWNIDAVNFPEMLEASISKTYGLLASMNNFPGGAIVEFAKADPEFVRNMFKDLFDESKDVIERIAEFKRNASIIHNSISNGEGQHYQYENAITTYLWLRYPDKYYIYKYGEAKAVSEKLDSNYQIKKGQYNSNLQNFLSLYDEINGILKKQSELIEMLNGYLTSDCYSDSELKTLTIDFGFYVSRYYNEEDTASQKSNAAFLRWFRPIIDALRELGGSATPAKTREIIIKNEELSEEEIAETRGKNNVNKFENEVAFARSYLVKSGYIDNSVNGVWTLTEKGFTAEMSDEIASTIFRAEYTKARNEKNNGEDALGDIDKNTIRYWLYAPGHGASKWEEFYSSNIMAIGWDEIGDLSEYDTRKDIIARMKEVYGQEKSYKMDSYATWQFANEIKPGDIVFVKKGMYQIIGRGIVESDYKYDDSRYDYKSIRRVNWTHKGEWKHPGQAAMKTLTDITNYTDYVEKLKALFDDEYEEEIEEPAVTYSEYNKEKLLKEVYISETEYDTLCGIIKNKKNLILQGPPGVGKTFAAKRLAYSIMGEKNPTRVTMVQFHQSYSYEDFIMGFRPNETGFELHKGAFYEFCKTAEEDSENDYFFIIDEINRGNLSKIFGELFMLIESDKRGIALQLLYSDEKFSVPENLYIIGMMNTADRSLAMLDYALRRRFAFFEMKPSFATVGFKDYQKSLNSTTFDNLILTISDLNREIAEDESLGDGFSVGHSYFCNLKEASNETLERIVEYEIIPLLKEYWFDEKDKVRRWSDRLRSAIK